MEECRREFVDRETRDTLLGFGDCEKKCYGVYHGEGCGPQDGLKERGRDMDGEYGLVE